MLVAAVVLLAVLVALALAAAAVVVAPHVWVLRAERVIVNLRGGNAVTGTVLADRGRRIVLAQAELHEAGQTARLDGRAVIEKGNVEFVQVLPAREPGSSAGAGS